MKIQVNTDRNLDGSAELITQVAATLEGALSRFSNRITRVEVHLSDENGSQKSGSSDKRCVLEARSCSPVVLQNIVSRFDHEFAKALAFWVYR